MDLKNKIALVTGSAVRVGKVIALHLAQRGCHVAVHYCSSQMQAANTAKQLRSMGVRAEIFKADLRSVKQLQKMATTVAKKMGPIDILINSASIYDRTPLFKITEKDWDDHQNINAKGAFFLSRFCAQAMLKRRTGKIVNIADSDMHHPYNNYLPYMVSKSALVEMTICLARELAPYVQVNAIGPGPVLLPPKTSAAQLKKIIAATPLGRIGSPEDVAAGVLFCLEGSDFITGALIPIDGGQHIT